MQEVHAELPVITGRIELVEIDDRRQTPALERRIAVAERRGSPRRKILKIARTYWQNGDSVECGIRNLSESGAQLEVRGPIPNSFDLVIDCDQFRRTCCVIWRNAGRIGVRFVEQNTPAQVSGGSVSRITEFRQYAEVCRTLARSSELWSREMLLKMAAAWETHARRPRNKASIW
jgi:hypothetical protein